MIREDSREQVELIREVFAYSERFRGSTFVIKIANEIIDHPDFPQHARDLALLHNAGIRTVIVPGARRRIDEVLERFNEEKHFQDGIRITPPASIDLIKMAAFDVAHRVMSALSGHRITAVIGNWVRARSRGVHSGIDFGRTGIVDRIRLEAVTLSLDQGCVPIFPCIGHNQTGAPFNLSSDELAGSLAGTLSARKLFHLGAHPVMRTPDWNVPGTVEVLENGRIFRMTPEDVPEILSLNPEKPGREELESAAAACRAGIDRAHILDGHRPGALLTEIFSNLGTGTMIFADDYERLRPMEPADLPGILEIMRPLAAEGILVERTREELKHKLGDYWVYAIDGVVHGCAALHPAGEHSGEIAGLAVDPRCAQLGIGAKLLTRLTEKAAETGITRLFALTTRTADWFLARGFREAGAADLPHERRALYNPQRGSRVLIKDISNRPRTPHSPAAPEHR